MNWLLLMYAKELQDDFHGAVDDYLEICKKESIMNRKGLKSQLESLSVESLSAQRPALIHNAMSRVPGRLNTENCLILICTKS